MLNEDLVIMEILLHLAGALLKVVGERKRRKHLKAQLIEITNLLT